MLINDVDDSRESHLFCSCDDLQIGGKVRSEKKQTTKGSIYVAISNGSENEDEYIDAQTLERSSHIAIYAVKKKCPRDTKPNSYGLVLVS